MAPAAAAKKPAAKPKPEKKKVDKEETEIPKVQAPDRTAFDEKIGAVQAEIEKMQKEQSALTAKINQRSGGSDEYHAKRAELRSQLDEYSGKMNTLQEQKENILKSMGDKRQEGQQMKQQVQAMKKTIGFSSEQEIDQRIADIQFKMWTESITLKEEKKYLQEIQELKRNKPKVDQVKKMENNLENFDTGVSLKEKLTVINEEMAKWRDAKRKVQEMVSELVEKRKDQVGDTPQLRTERDEIGKKIQEKIKEKNELRDEFKKAEKEYYAALAEVRQARAEKAREEREKKRAEFEQRQRVKKAEQLDTQPYLSEITLLEQTISFCKSLTQTKDNVQNEEKKEIAHNNPENTQVLLKKEDRDEFYFVPTKSKKGKSKKGAKGESGGSKPIKHNAETFRLFDQLKLDAPITTDDIPETLENLESQLKEYNDKVKEWQEQREELKRKILEDGWSPEEAAQENKENQQEEAEEETAEASKNEDDKDEDKDDEKKEAED